MHDTPRSLIRVTCKPGPLTGKISRDWQFSPRPCTEFLLVSDMVGASSELEKNNKKPIQTPNNVIVAETLLYQDKSLAKTGIFGKCNIWCFSSALGGGSIKWWGVAEYHIFQGCSKMLGKKGFTSGRRMEPIADYRSLKRLRDVAAFTSCNYSPCVNTGHRQD